MQFTENHGFEGRWRLVVPHTSAGVDVISSITKGGGDGDGGLVGSPVPAVVIPHYSPGVVLAAEPWSTNGRLKVVKAPGEASLSE